MANLVNEIRENFETKRLEFFGFTKTPGIKRLVKSKSIDIIMDLDFQKMIEFYQFFKTIGFLDLDKSKCFFYSVSEYQELTGDIKAPDFMVLESKSYKLTSRNGKEIQMNSVYYLFALDKYKDCQDKFPEGLDYCNDRLKALKSNYIYYQDLLREKIKALK